MGLTRIRAQQITDTDYKQAVRVATDVDITLTGGAPVVVDGVTLQVNNRVLVRQQTDAAQNGLYVVSTVGVGSNGTWVRSSDADQTGEISSGMVVMVTEGVAYADVPWKLTTDGDIVVGTTELTFEQFGSGATAPGGSTTQLQFNNNNTFTGSPNLVFDGSNVTVAGAVISNDIVISGQTDINHMVISGNVTGNLLPSENITYDLGSPDQRWKDLYLSNTTIYIGNAEISASGANIILPSTVHIGNAVLTEHNGSLTLPENISAVTIEVTGNVTADNFIGNGSQLTGLPAGYADSNVVALLSSFGSSTVSTTGNVTAGNFVGTLVGSATSATTAATVTTAAQPNITSVGTMSVATITTLTTAGITKSGANGVGNIGAAGSTFDTVFAKATSAQYADLAEMYASDTDYPVGTVLVIGGTHEVTISTHFAQTTIIGTVSDNPAYIMNSGISADHVTTVALTGRVPVRVTGKINRGDLLGSSTVPGHATSLSDTQWRPGAVIGKALESYDSADPGIIEAIVGRI